MKNVAQINENGQVIRFIDACEPSQVWSAINMEVKESSMMGKPAPRFAVMNCEFTPGGYMSAGGYSYQRKVVGIATEFDMSVFPGSYRRIDEAVRSAFDAMLEGVTK